MYSMEDFRNDFLEFFSGNAFWVAMALLIIYGVGYIKYLQKVAMRKNRNEFGEPGEGQLIRYTNAIFWQRLRRFDFFAVLYIVVCLALITLPFTLVTLHSNLLRSATTSSEPTTR
jgi:hypothetical protein